MLQVGEPGLRGEWHCRLRWQGLLLVLVLLPLLPLF